MWIRYLEWWNTRCEVSGFMFIHLFLQSLYKDMLLYFFFSPFLFSQQQCTKWMQWRWDSYSESHFRIGGGFFWFLGFLDCKQTCPGTLWQLGLLGVSPQPAGEGRKGQRDGVCWRSYCWNCLGYKQICPRSFLQRGDVLATSAGCACKRAGSGFVSPACGKEGLLGLLVLEDFWNVGEQGLIFLLGLSGVNCRCFEIKWQSHHKTEIFFPPPPCHNLLS